MEYNLITYPGVEDGNEEQISKSYQLIEKMDGVRQAMAVKRLVALQENGDYTKDAKGDPETGEFTTEDLDAMVTLYFFSVSDDVYREFLKENRLSYEEAADKALIFDETVQSYMTEDGDTIRKQYHYLNSDAGDVISFRELMGEESEESELQQIEIAKRVEKMPFGLQNNYSDGVSILLSNEMMGQLGGSDNGMYIDAEDTKALSEKIENLNDGVEWYIVDYDAMAREQRGMWLIISIFVYGFIGVISVIGITNVFNTITTNMTLRSREFAILRSVGMTDKEFKRMIRFESLLYGGKALLLGLPVGVGLSYIMYLKFVGIMEVPYEIPWGPMGIAAVFVFLIIFLTMGYSVRKTKKQNIIETIRSENV